MPTRRDTLRASEEPDAIAPTVRKEDYKAYTERDLDEGWPYSDDQPGTEEVRLQGNRPYAADDDLPAEAAVEGFHVEELPDDAVDMDDADEAALDDIENDDKPAR